MDKQTLTMYNAEDESTTKVLYNQESSYELLIGHIEDNRYIYLTKQEAKELYRFLGEVLNEKGD